MKINNIYEFILIILFAMNLGIGLADHGKQKTGKTNFIIVFVSIAMYGMLMYYAGLFH